MGHNRKLVIGGVALVKAKLKHDIEAMSAVRDEVESFLIQSDFFAGAPFEWIGLVIRFGLIDSFEPVYQGINKRSGDLPISIEIDAHSLLGADVDTMTLVIRRATIEALLHIGRKYKLSTKPLENLRSGST